MTLDHVLITLTNNNNNYLKKTTSALPQASSLSHRGNPTAPAPCWLAHNFWVVWLVWWTSQGWSGALYWLVRSGRDWACDWAMNISLDFFAQSYLAKRIENKTLHFHITSHLPSRTPLGPPLTHPNHSKNCWQQNFFMGLVFRILCKHKHVLI